MSPESLDFGRTVLLGAAVLLVAVYAVRLSARFGLPTLLLYLGLGVLLGEAGPFGIGFDNAQLAQILAFSALILILTEGGLTTHWERAKGAMPFGLVLATLGVGISTAVVGVLAHYLVGLDWSLAFLIGAVTAPTDAAAVFSVLRRVPLPGKLKDSLEVESGLNDAPSILLVTLLSAPQLAGPVEFAAHVGWELVVGVLIGAAIGYLGAQAVRRIRIPASAPSALAIIAVAILAYGAADVAAASGFAAVYVAALVLGNSGLPFRRTTRSFAEGLAWLAQIGLFIMLGLLAWPSRLSWWDVVAALGIGLILTFVARPVSVLFSGLLIRRLKVREQLFCAWAGLRGAVPIVLATIPLAAGTPHADTAFDVVFILVLVFTLLQAPTLPFVARRLGLAQPVDVGELDVESGPLEVLDADLLELRIGPDSRLAGVEVGELRLPATASVALLIRQDSAIVPTPRTVLRAGDDVLVVAPRDVRDRTEKRLRAVSRGGRLARWLRER